MRVLKVVLVALTCSACLESLVSFAPIDAGPPHCAAGLTLCEGGCTSVSDDSLNCGGCGQPCGLNQVCARGSCYEETCVATKCTAGQVCIDEHCRSKACTSITCDEGSTCFKDSCWESRCATHTCSPGLVCLVDDCVDPDCVGINCGGSLTCKDGQCVDVCIEGATCTPSENPCHVGVSACTDAGRVCTERMQNLPVGTACGDAGVCNAGLCTACAQGADCTTSSDPCHFGTVSCATGVAVCQGSHAVVPTGTSCGIDQVCVQGRCVACQEGAKCMAAAQCHVGQMVCTGSTGPACVDLGGLQAPGTACGTDAVCSGDGGCVACKAGVTCVPANECYYGKTDCSQGKPTCVSGSKRPTGTPCDGGTCNVLGACSR